MKIATVTPPTHAPSSRRALRSTRGGGGGYCAIVEHGVFDDVATHPPSPSTLCVHPRERKLFWQEIRQCRKTGGELTRVQPAKRRSCKECIVYTTVVRKQDSGRERGKGALTKKGDFLPTLWRVISRKIGAFPASIAEVESCCSETRKPGRAFAAVSSAMLSRTVLCGCGGGISGQEGKEEYSGELSSLPKGPKKSKRYSTLEDLFRPPPPTVLILFLVLLLPCLTAASSISAAPAAAGTSDDEGGGPESGGEGGKHHFPDGGGEQQQPPVAPPEPGKDREDEGKEGEDTAATGYVKSVTG